MSLNDNSIGIWNITEKTLVQNLVGHDKPAYSIAFSPDSKFLASKSEDNSVRLWNCESWSEISIRKEFGFPKQEIEIAFHPFKNILVTFNNKNTIIETWEIQFKKLLDNMSEKKFFILFLSSNPVDFARLRTDKEAEKIREKLRLAKLYQNFSFDVRMATRAEDFSQALLDKTPNIVHFAGHGLRSGEICLEDEIGNSHPVSPESLRNLFALVSDHVDCVILNACYSEAQASAIAEHIKFVIGTSYPVMDDAAIAFSVGFYQALGIGKTIEEAYKFGCVQVGLTVNSKVNRENVIPIIKKNKYEH